MSALVLLAGCEPESVPLPMELEQRTADMSFTPQRTPWSAPVRLGPAINSPTANEAAVNLGPVVNSTAGECAATFSIDGTMMLFTSNRAGGAGGNDC